MTIYVTADPHFLHARIIELCARPFDNAEEMSEALVDNYNEVMSAGDTLYVLGDACLGNLDDSLAYILGIEAYTILVPGNHDRPSRAYQRKGDIALKIENARQRYLKYFDEVLLEPVKGPSVFDSPFEWNGRPVPMSHYPYTGDSHGEERYRELRPKDDGHLPILHGHVHTEWQFNGRQFNVGVDVNDFRPVHEDTINEWLATV